MPTSDSAGLERSCESVQFRPTTQPPQVPSSARCELTTDFRRICPNCGAQLWDKECKSRCPRCHFFTDCSDPW